MEFLAELFGFVLKAVVIAKIGLVLIASMARAQQGKEGGLRVIDWVRVGRRTALSFCPFGIRKPKRPKSRLKKQRKRQFKEQLWVINFNGDMRASGLKGLREAISAVLVSAEAGKDAVCIRLKSPGGGVTEYGLAASQLIRIKDAGCT